jgi:hypothetical protein
MSETEQKLALYDQLRSALTQNLAVDEIAGIKNKAAQLEAYARVRDDVDSQRKFGEIRLRACIRIGELSRELEKAPPIRGDLLPIAGKKITKEQALAKAGISTSTAQRYEELAGGREEQAQGIASQAAEVYFATQEQLNEPVTMAGLKSAVKESLVKVGHRRMESPDDGAMIDLINPKETSSEELFRLAEKLKIYGNQCIERSKYIQQLAILRKKRGL